MTDNNSWDYLIEYTKDKVNKDSLDWLVIPELKKGAEPAFRNGTKTALVSNIIGQYMQALEIEEEKTGAPAEPEFTAFKKSFDSFYKRAVAQFMEDMGLSEKGKQPEKILHNLPAVRPVEHALAIDKITNKAFINAFLDSVTTPVAMEKKGDPIKVTTYVTINYDGLDRAKVQGLKWLTLYDREVLDAIHTLFKAGNSFVTIDQINRVMNGRDDDKKATPKQAERINNSITKMMYTQIIIDASEEAKYWGCESFTYDNPVIVGRRGEAILNGSKVQGVFIVALAFLGYAENRNQIKRAPLQLKASPINKNEAGTVLQGYLLRRVNAIKAGAIDNTILVDTLLTDLNIIDTNKNKLTSVEANKRKATIDQIKIVLDHFIKTDEWIKGYEIIGKRPVRGFKIFY